MTNTTKMAKVSAAALLLSLLGGFSASAYFEDLGRDARSRGMANAVISTYGGVHSIHYNPAGILRTGQLEFNFEWGVPLTMGDLSDGSSFDNLNVSLMVPFGDMAAALSFEQRDSGQLVTERLITLGFGMVLDKMLPGAKISAGLNLDFYMLGFQKTADWQYLPDNPKDSVFAFGIDLGVIYHFSDAIRIGAVFENLLKPNFTVFEDGENYEPTNVKLGASMALRNLGPMEVLTVAGNYVMYGKFDELDNTVGKTSFHFGFEGWMANRLFGIRSGIVLGNDEMNEFTSGISVNVAFGNNTVLLDYAFSIPLGVEGFRHLLGLTWKMKMSGTTSDEDAERRRRG